MIRLLVCGGRNFADRQLLEATLDDFLISHDGIDILIEGEARGADKMARQWALDRGVLVAKYPADWQRLGKAAGPIRNSQMLNEGKPTHGIAFYGVPRNESRGTADMVRKMKRAGVPVEEYGP